MSVQTTPAWHDEVCKQFRYPGRVKMTIDIMSTVSTADMEASATNIKPITDVVSTIDGYNDDYPAIATMEGLWRADGSMYLPSKVPSENKVLPLMSDTLISATHPVLLMYDFKTETSFIGLTVSWDELRNAWPKALIVKGYNGSTEKYSYTISNITEYMSILDTPMDNVTSVSLEVLAWSKPELLLRMSEIYFGVMLQLTERTVMSISETTEQDLFCSKLPKDTQKYTLRNQIYRTLVAQGGTAVANKSSPLTGISRLFNGSAATEGIASVEIRYWKADGSLYLPSTIPAENSNIPWMSEDANFSATDPIEIVITYEHPVQINQVSFTWDLVTNSWPTNATLEGVDVYGTSMFRSDFSATGPVSTFSSIYSTVKTVHLTIRAWSQKGWRARIGQYEALMMYGNNNIPSEVNNLFDPTLAIGYSKYLARRQKIKVKYGLETYNQGTLWMPEQIRFLDSWEVPTNAIQAVFQATTRLAFLTKEYTQGTYNASGTTLYNLAAEILQSSNIIRDIADATPWVLCDKLKQFSTTAPLPRKAENSLLQLIANASGCHLDTDPTNGYVRISDALPDSQYTINEDIQQQVPSVTLNTPLKSIAVKMYKYTVETEASELFNGTITLDGTSKVTITYNDEACATNCKATITGATVVAQQFYGRTAVLTLTATGSVSIVITGYKIASSSAEITTFYDTEVESGKEIVIDNVLVTNLDLVNAVAEAAKAYYSRRSTAKMDYLGFPDLKAGDRVAMYSQYMNENAHIKKHTFKYNGAFSGNVEMLMEV